MIEDIGSYPFNETINKSKGLKIIKHWDEIFATFPKDRQRKINEGVYDPLLCLKKICKSKSNFNVVKYSYSKTAKTFGRLFAKSASLQNLPREFRGALAFDLYHDIDIQNAHPSFLYQYCNTKGFKCDVLKQYVENRDHILNDLSSKFNLEPSDIKNLILTLINGGKREGLVSGDTFLTNLNNELKIITDNIILTNPMLEKQAKKVHKNDPNIKGKIVNLLLCNIENDTMLTAVEYLLENNYEVDVLVFDGFMVRKNIDKPITTELLDDVSKYVMDKTGYSLKFVEKPLDNTINVLLKQYDDVSIGKEEASYPKDKTNFEKTHFKTMFPPSITTINENGEIIIQKISDFSSSYAHIKTTIVNASKENAIEVRDFVSVWLHDESIRIYDKFDFYPVISDCPPNHYNLFKGFKVEKYAPIVDKTTIPTLIEPILYHLKVLAQDDYEFINKYFAFIIQYPNKKTKVNIVVAGKDGTGKSIIFDYFREMILGDKLSVQTDNTDDLFSPFSNLLVEKLFLQIDEINCDDFKHKKNERLKNIIVAPKIKLEKKGVDAIMINNYSNSVMTTNNDFTIPISQTDRRNVFFKASDTHKQDEAYFKKLASTFRKEDVARAFYEYLMSYDISGGCNEWSEDQGLQSMRPNTKFYKDTKMMNLPIIYRFLSKMTNYVPTQKQIIKSDSKYYGFRHNMISLKATEFYDVYCEWFHSCNYNTTIASRTKFCNDIKDISSIEKTRHAEGCYYIYNKNELLGYLQANELFDEYA